jgi:hypothetical protein
MTKPITFYPHETRHLLAVGSVLLVRPVKPPIDEAGHIEFEKCYPRDRRYIAVWRHWYSDRNMYTVITRDCPLGAPGEVRYVAEMWALLEPEPEIRMHANAAVRYQSDGDVSDVTWRSPVTMPRWVSRATVQVTSVEVRRVQDISRIDYRDILRAGHGDVYKAPEQLHNYLLMWWAARYGKRYPYAGNPWCWCVLATLNKEA